MNSSEIVAAIDAHLKRFEADQKTRVRADGRTRFYQAGCWQAGSWIKILYIGYQGATSLRKADAEKYLGWLNAGNVGRHYEALREQSK